MKLRFALCALLGAAVSAVNPVSALAGKQYADRHEVEVTLIHTGDFHGHLIPRANVRSDGNGLMEGGLARVYTKIRDIRKHHRNTLLLHTGDTIQGGAEVLYTRGQAIVDVLDHFGIDGFAPGNWEFVYGKDRFVELFGKGRWNTVSANVRHATAAGIPCSQGDYVVPPYVIKQVGGARIALLGFTTDRGPQVVGSAVTDGLCFLSSVPGSSGTADVSEVEAELQAQIARLRNQEDVDIIVMLSELGLANNSLLAQRNDGIDVILSSDMHEETPEAVVVTTPNGGRTILAEEGQDGTMLGELEIKIDTLANRISKWQWKAHTINSRIREDRRISRKIEKVRRPFVAGSFKPHTNPFNGSVLSTPIDSIIGETEIPLHRSNFSHEDMPGAIEGTSHDFLTDAFRFVAGTDIGAIRGFRYGTHLAPGIVRLEDIYHYMPIGPIIARGSIPGQAVKNQIENPADGAFNPDPRRWTGGWLFGFSGVSFDLDLYRPAGQRASNIMINGVALDTTRRYSYASYWYANDPGLINRIAATNIELAVRADDGRAMFVPIADAVNYPAMDGTEVVWQYLRDNLGGRLTDLQTHRVNLLAPLPAPVFGNAEVQPLRGAQ